MRYNILIVEDSRADSQLLQEAFRVCGHDCTLTFASSLKEARIYLSTLHFQMVIIDLLLSGEDGLTLVKAIRSDSNMPPIPLIALSGVQGRTLEAYQAGMNCFIAKSADLPGFIDKITSLMNFWVRVAELPSIQPVLDRDSRLIT